jgi:acyl-CoA synthetase (AMP-forming)/AMP-acid ligase II
MDDFQATSQTRLTHDARPGVTPLFLRRHQANAFRSAQSLLVARGVREGDAIALCAPPSIELAAARNAATSIGAVVVTLSPKSPRRELCGQLCRSGARWLVTTSDLFAQKLEVAARPSAVVETFLIP